MRTRAPFVLNPTSGSSALFALPRQPTLNLRFLPERARARARVSAPSPKEDSAVLRVCFAETGKAYTREHTKTRTRARAHTHTHTYTHKKHARTRTHTHAAHVNTHARTRHTQKHARTRTQTYYIYIYNKPTYYIYIKGSLYSYLARFMYIRPPRLGKHPSQPQTRGCPGPPQRLARARVLSGTPRISVSIALPQSPRVGERGLRGCGVARQTP